MKKKNFIIFAISIIVSFTLIMAFSSCSSSKESTRPKYKQVKVKQPNWNTTTSNSTTYVIKHQKRKKRYNP